MCCAARRSRAVADPCRTASGRLRTMMSATRSGRLRTMMSATRFEEDPEELGRLVEAVWGLQHQLLRSAQSLLVTLERPSAVWAVEDAVRGQTAHFGPGRLDASERAAMCASLRQDIQALQQLSERLAQLDRLRQVYTPAYG